MLMSVAVGWLLLAVGVYCCYSLLLSVGCCDRLMAFCLFLFVVVGAWL